MGDSQQFKLRWNNHRDTLVRVLNTLLSNGAYVDCTLAAEGKQISAHKIVLSACSSYLNDILQAHDNKHPVLILKDIKFSDLEAMVEYMYNGEVNVTQDNLNNFLKAADSLKLAGLSGNNSNEQTEQLKRKQRTKHTMVKREKLDNSFINKPNENVEDVKNKPILINGNELPTSAPLEQLENFERNFKEKYERSRSNLGNITNSNENSKIESETLEHFKKYKGSSYEEEDDVNFDSSNEAGPSNITSVLDYHVNSDDQNRCIRCERKFLSKHDLLNHAINQCGRFFRPFRCARCNKSYSYKRGLQSHMAKECGKQPQYRCPYCPQRSTQKSNLSVHVRKMHPEKYDLYMSVISGPASQG